jgi:hypothetical protein
MPATRCAFMATRPGRPRAAAVWVVTAGSRQAAIAVLYSSGQHLRLHEQAAGAVNRTPIELRQLLPLI